MSPPLAGVRVLDLSSEIAGPYCTKLLADAGADVVKVEPPEGDWGRAIGRRHGDFSAYAVAFNRGKRSAAVDLKRPEGREVVARLVARADVVVENNRPGVLARYMGLSAAAVTNRLNHLEERGLVRRLPDATDRRGIQVEPAEVQVGLAAHAEAELGAGAHNEAYRGRPDDRPQCARACSRCRYAR
jgi:hypothetical protein